MNQEAASGDDGVGDVTNGAENLKSMKNSGFEGREGDD